MDAMKGSSSADVVREFFAAFGRGNVEGVIGTFHPDARIVAVRQAVRKENELYGNYEGQEGARILLTTLGTLFDTQTFRVDQVLGEGDVVFASGSFIHKVKSTGKPFSSDWALRCVIKDGKILQYRFFEDSAAYVEASR